VIIGVASVIATLALGNGTRAAVEASFRQLGSDQIQITTQYKNEQGERVPAGKILSYEDGLLMPKAVGLIDYVELYLLGSGRLRYGQITISGVIVQGTMANQLAVMAKKTELQPVGWSDEDTPKADAFLDYGSYFSSTEVKVGAEVCVLGYQTAEDLFDGMDPLGEIVRVNRRTCDVIGIMAELEAVDPMLRELKHPNEGIYMPISTVVQDLFEEEPAVTITAHVTDEATIDEAKSLVAAFLRQRHGIEQNSEGYYEDDFYMTTNSDLIGAQQEAARTFALLLTALACVSLVVGGIGIMNVMLVSVTERMREIGVRRAVGARRRDIAVQFLMEALLLSVASGIMGIALGILILPMVALLNENIVLLDPTSIPLAFGVALLTGSIFGLYPALRAARLDPIVALRYE
jgi:ABC-type antimicrobial peptide transport system permease subunit